MARKKAARGANDKTQLALDWALVVAAKTGQEGLAKALIEGGANVNHGSSAPLIEAARAGQTKLALLLLEAGADSSPPTRWRTSAAREAAIERQMDTAKAILDWDERRKKAGPESP